MKKWFLLGLVLVLSLFVVATASAAPAQTGGGDKYAVCHVDGQKGEPWYSYEYLEIGGLSGHFYGGNPNFPKHGAFHWNGDQFESRWDFVTVLGDRDCDGQVDEIPGCTDEAALNFDPEANTDDGTCYYECDFTHEVQGLSSPGAWTEWEWDGLLGQFVRSRVIRTAFQLRDDTTNALCDVRSEETTEYQYRDPNEVVVDVGVSCGAPAEDGVVYQTYFGVSIAPAGGATVYFLDQEFTENAGGHAGFGTYPWSAEASDGYVLAGDSEGSVHIGRDECNEVEKPPETGGGDASALLVVLMSGVGLAALYGGARLIRKEM